ncbi:MAG: ribonuclease Z [Deltaproteobacteria bacterium]|nr:ribonuclease Z [Deltaproteobacteria bacterium]
MQIHFLGTNGWFNAETGETSCVLVDAQEAYVIFDAGNGLRKLERHITDPAKPIYLCLSHFHLDHVYGLHMLPKFRFPQGITILGQPGTERTLRSLLGKPWTAPLERLPTAVRFQEVGEGNYTAPFPLVVRFLVHSDPCIGFRVTLEGKTITYCTDTGTCEQLSVLGHNADCFITECSWRVPQQQPGWPHLAPEDAAAAARAANARQLALVHFEGYTYPTLEARTEAETRARAIFPATRAMHDDDVITL